MRLIYFLTIHSERRNQFPGKEYFCRVFYSIFGLVPWNRQRTEMQSFSEKFPPSTVSTRHNIKAKAKRAVKSQTVIVSTLWQHNEWTKLDVKWNEYLNIEANGIQVPVIKATGSLYRENLRNINCMIYVTQKIA